MCQLKEIARKINQNIFKFRNGATVQTMRSYGVNYRKNFGVGHAQLKEIALAHQNNHELALFLWDPNSRERMILASLVDTPQEVTKEQMLEWGKQFFYTEIREQVNLNLFSKTPLALEVGKEWVEKGKNHEIKSGLHLLARYIIRNKETFNRTEVILNSVSKGFPSFSTQDLKQWAFLMRALFSTNEKIKTLAIEEIKRLKNTTKETRLKFVQELEKDLLSF